MRLLFTLFLLALLAGCGSEEPQTSVVDQVVTTVEDLRREGAELLGDEEPLAQELHNEYEGAYRLHSMFRGEQECLDANYHDADTNHGGVFMAPCDGSDDQTWQFTPVDAGHYQIWTLHEGEKLCLDGNERESVVHEGAAFVEPCRSLIVGQRWTLTPEDNGFVRMHTEYREHSDCFESNQAGNAAHSGASYMDSCQNVTGQLWRLVRVDAPPA